MRSEMNLTALPSRPLAKQMHLVGTGVRSKNRQSVRRKSLLRTFSERGLVAAMRSLVGGKDFFVGVRYAPDHGLYREMLMNPCVPSRRQPSGKIRVGQNPLDSSGQGGWVGRRDEETGLAVN